uniref:Uncharacterized protein n=1 Tax=Oryza glumipatula TaxID=40148 RepID=A0A0D9ZRS8_9ORYZ
MSPACIDHLSWKAGTPMHGTRLRDESDYKALKINLKTRSPSSVHRSTPNHDEIHTNGSY